MPEDFFTIKWSEATHPCSHLFKFSHSCKICRKHFAWKSNLKKHMNAVHLGTKDQKCNLCGKTFAQNYCLVEHMRVHTREAPSKCRKCVTSFTTKSGLRHHMLSHK